VGEHRREHGVRFDDPDVARCYAHRAPYAPQLYEFLLGLVPGRERALDLGCGPGKIARVLAPHFACVTAIDPSPSMLALGREGAPANIEWICSAAEDVPFGAFDLATAGASLHWMRHEVVFPRLAEGGGLIAVIDGDDAFEAPFAPELEKFLTRWLARVGRRYDPAGFKAELESNRPWIDLEGEQSFVYEHRVALDNYVAAQHARATWTRAVMGQLARAFDDDLAETLAPFATDGDLRFRVKSNLVWGRPRTSPRS
jgi:SAM-dependent methyltransferase